MREPLRESLASATGSSVGEEVGTEPSTASKRVIVSVAGPGFSDSEEFDIADLRCARASARKLMASAIRLFGKAEGTESE
jgi:hypothetical protein